MARLVEPLSVEGDRGRDQDPVLAAGVARDDVVDDDAALTSSIAVSGKSAGVGAGGVVSTKPQAATASATETEAERSGE